MGKASRRHRREKLEDVPLQPNGIYRNRQPATALMALIAIPLGACLLALMTGYEHRELFLTMTGVLVIGALLFSSLSTKVDDTLLQWRFGPGLIRKKLPINEIESVEITRSGWIDGWGIHYTKRGWIYNVSGFDAVFIRQKNGRHILIGSNDVVGLWEAIELRIKA